MRKTLLFSFLLTILSLNVIAGPYISATPSVLNSLNYTTGSGPSASQMVVLQSGFMAITSGTVTVTGTSDYELSLDNSNFSATVSIPYSNDVLAATNLYIRLKSGLSVGNYMNETISVAATYISQSITANGMVTSPCVISTGAVTGNSASFTWNATGANSYECKIDQTSAAPATSGTPASGTAYSESGLNSNTNYYFHVRGVDASNSNYTAWTTKAFSTKAAAIANMPSGNCSFSLLPNPSQGGTFTVNGMLSSKAGDEVAIVVLNALGQEVYRTATRSESGAFSKLIQLSVPAGIYVVRVGAGDEYGVMRLQIGL
jgi:hypothetical protein